MATKSELEARILVLELAVTALQKKLEKVEKKANNPIPTIGGGKPPWQKPKVIPDPDPFPYEPWCQRQPRVTWDDQIGWTPSYQPKI